MNNEHPEKQPHEHSDEVGRSDEHRLDRLDRATAARLAKLRSLPVDVSRLEKRLRAEGGPPPAADTAGPARRPWLGWLRPYRAVAALLLAAVTVAAVLLTTSGGPALASPAQMAQVHEDLVAGHTPVTRVDSIEEASRALSREWSQTAGLPGVPEAHVMACCMKAVHDKRMACVLLKAEGVPVTMAVASAADMRLPTSPTWARGGVIYHVQSAGRLNMVMTDRQGRWVCLIAELPVERLMDLANQLRF